MTSALLARLAEVIIRSRWVTLVLCVLVTFVLLAGTGGLSIVINPDKSLPQNHPFTIATNLADRLFGNKFAVIIGITPNAGNALQPSVIAVVRGITNVLAQDANVVRGNLASLAAKRVKDISGSQDGLEIRQLLAQADGDGRRLQAVLARNPVYAGLLLSHDQRTAAIIADFREDPAGFQAIAARVASIVAPFRTPNIKISVAGQAIFLGLTETYSARMVFLFPLALVIIGLIHYEAFGTWQGLLLPLVTGLVATGWALGIMGWTHTSLDAFNVATPILILAVAAGHAVQILKRYYEEYRTASAGNLVDLDAANRVAIIRTLATTGPVMIAAGLTAVASFSSLLVFRIGTIRTFGLFTALGIVSALVLELTLIPALRAVLPPPTNRQMSREGADRFWGALTGHITVATIRAPRRVLACALVILCIAIAGAAQIRVDNSLRSYFLSSVTERQEDKLLNSELAGNNVLQVIVRGHDDDTIKSPAVLGAMAETQTFLNNEAAVGKTVSLVDFVRRIDRAMNDEDPARPLPATRDLIAQYLLLYTMSGDPTDFDSLVDSGYRTAVITAYLKEESSAYLLDLDHRLRAFVAQTFPPNVDVLIGGNVMSPVALNEVLVSNKLLNMVQIACAVFLVSALLFRSLVGGLLVLIPLMLAAVVNFGLMGWFGIPLQVATASVSAIAIGIGADYAIYLLYRMREEAATVRPEVAIARALHSAGKAIMFVATAIAGGYSVLMLSWGFLVHFWIGLLISVAMVTSAASALMVLPAIAVLGRPRFLFGAVVGVALLLLAAAPASAQASAQALSAEEVMQRNFVASKPNDSVADATFTLISGDGQQRVRQVHTWTRLREDGTSDMRLTRFVAPPDVRGTATLTIENSEADDDIWIYLPALKRVRRLIASNKKDSYVGTDFSYADIIGLKVNDWHHAVVGRETMDGSPCYIIDSTPANPAAVEASGYGRRKQWIRTDTFVTVRGEYADATGRPWKIFHGTDFRLADPARNRWQAMRLELRDLQTNHATVIALENYHANQGLDTALFSARLLDREQ